MLPNSMVSLYQPDPNYFDSWRAFDSANLILATRGYLHERISVSHQTLLPRGQVQYDKADIEVLIIKYNIR